ncbi:MAG: hypothetical protein M0Z61_08220, partial [Nitrospiraceae bacterium]|nr:hypothetical protein [Nitrospiraceae bacterium]
LNLSINNFSGYYELGGGLPQQGYTPGPMGAIPSAYQSQVGGKILTGQSLGVAIATTESYGPCAIALDPSNLVPSNLPPAVIPATALIYYDSSHPLPGGYWANDQASNVYTSPSDKIYGIVFPDNTRSVLYFGAHGLASTDGYSCYGPGTNSLSAAYSDSCPGGVGTCSFADRLVSYQGIVNSGTFQQGETVTQATTNATGILVKVDTVYGLEFLKSAKPIGGNTTDTWTGQTSRATFNPTPNSSGGDEVCYDLARPDKGTHAYPYVNYVWAYDVGDTSGNNTAGNNVNSLNSSRPDINNLTAVKLGLIKPYEIVPYATWTFTLPTGQSSLTPGNFSGAAWDSVNRLLYVTQTGADGGSKYPVVHVYKINIP